VQAIQITITANCSACTALKARDLDLLTSKQQSWSYISIFLIEERPFCVFLGVHTSYMWQTHRQTDRQEALADSHPGRSYEWPKHCCINRCHRYRRRSKLLLKLLCHQGLPDAQLSVIANAIIISRLLYALPARGGFLSVELVNRINAFLTSAAFWLSPVSYHCSRTYE